MPDRQIQAVSGAPAARGPRHFVEATVRRGRPPRGGVGLHSYHRV